MLIVVAVLLGIAEIVGSQRKEVRDFGLIDAISRTRAGFGLMPEASFRFDDHGRLFAGQKTQAAARFSFMLSIPAITASGLLELKEAVRFFREKLRAAAGRDNRCGHCRLSFDLVFARLSA